MKEAARSNLRDSKLKLPTLFWGGMPRDPPSMACFACKMVPQLRKIKTLPSFAYGLDHEHARHSSHGYVVKIWAKYTSHSGSGEQFECQQEAVVIPAISTHSMNHVVTLAGGGFNLAVILKRLQEDGIILSKISSGSWSVNSSRKVPWRILPNNTIVSSMDRCRLIPKLHHAGCTGWSQRHFHMFRCP